MVADKHFWDFRIFITDPELKVKTLALEQVIIKRLLEQEEPVSIQPNSTIYVDMDGVVVDFHTPMIG